MTKPKSKVVTTNPQPATVTPVEANPRAYKPVLPTVRAQSGSFGDTLALVWVAFSFWVHFAFEGVWLFHHSEIANAPAVPDTPQKFFALFQKAWSHESALPAVYDTAIELVKSLWKGYALADKRFSTGDSFLKALFSVNFYFLAPSLVFLGYAIANRRSWRYSAQLTLTTIQLLGVALYFVTEHLNRYANVNPKSVKDYNVYFWTANLAFAFPTFILWVQAFFGARTQEPRRASNRIAFAIKFTTGATILGFAFLLTAALAHHFLDSAEVQKLLLEALDTGKQFAADAYATTSEAAAEGLHQAHVLAAPYVDQAADFIHQNIGGN